MTRDNLKSSVMAGLFLIGIAIATILPMFFHGYPIGHSTQFNLSWAFQYQRQFLAGQIYPRWLEFSNFGFGNATFVFYPPMWVIATLPFCLLGMDVPNSLIGSMVLAAFTLGCGIYRYANLYFPSWLSLAIASLAVASPYFLIDIYQRAAIGEVWAIAFIPWIFFFTHKLISQIHLSQLQRYHAISLAIAWGMLGLSHLPTLLIMFLVWLPMPLCLINTKPLKTYVIEVGRCYLSASLGFMGISFFLLPVIFDQRLVEIGLVNYSSEYLPQNRLILDGLLNLHPKLSTHWFDSTSGIIPYFWSAIAVLVLSAIALKNSSLFTQIELIQTESAILIQPSRDRAALFWLISGAIAILMTTDLLVWTYQLLPILQKIQFSWRWYGLTVTIIPLLGGYLFWYLWQLHGNGIGEHQSVINIRYSIIIIVFLSIVLSSYIYTDKIVFKHTGFDSPLVTKFSDLASQKEFPNEPNAEGKGIPILWWHWVFPDGLAIVDVPEYRARGVTLPMPPHQKYSLAAWQENGSTDRIQIKRWEYGLREILVDNQFTDSTPKYVALRMFYYPAWQIWIDGNKVALEATQEGQAQIAVPTGQHSILVKYVGTITEMWGKAISCFGVIFAGYVLWLSKPLNPVKSSD